MIKETPEGVLVTVKVLPRSSRCEICGIHGDAMKIKVTSPPVDGRANEEIIAFVADSLGIKKGRVTIVTGHAATRKTVAVAGCCRGDIDHLLGSGRLQVAVPATIDSMAVTAPRRKGKGKGKEDKP